MRLNLGSTGLQASFTSYDYDLVTWVVVSQSSVKSSSTSKSNLGPGNNGWSDGANHDQAGWVRGSHPPGACAHRPIWIRVQSDYERDPEGNGELNSDYSLA